MYQEKTSSIENKKKIVKYKNKNFLHPNRKPKH
jgi:hypothetical protein